MKPWQRPKSQRSIGVASPYDSVNIFTTNNKNIEATISNLIQQAKSSGKLVLCNKALETLPPALFTTYEVGKRNLVLDMGASSTDQNWWEVKPLLIFFLSDNSLASIPDNFATTFPDLVILDLHGNNLSKLPENFIQYQNLSTLNLARNQFQVFPACISNLPLVELNIAHNQLSESDPFFKTLITLDNLTQLNLSHNQLTQFTFELIQFQNLRKLDLSHNLISSLPASFISSSSLEEIDLSNNRLQSVPFFPLDSDSSQSAHFPNLIIINLQMNRILKVDCHLESKLPKLKHLLLTDNLLTSLGNVPHFLPQLSVLTLGNNRLDTFPESILTMSNLTQLDLSRNNFTRIPPQIGNLHFLHSLTLTGNPLRATPKMTTTQEFLEAMRKRIPSNCSPSTQATDQNPSVPDSAIETSTQEKATSPTLELSCQEVSSRTIRVSNMKLDDAALEAKLAAPLPFSPKHFEFNKNKLTRAPASMLEQYSESLSTINFAMNSLTSFVLTHPLPNLILLNLGGNRLTSFPLLEEGPSLCPRLDTLDLSMNRIPSLPLCPSLNFPVLSSLLISNNQVVDLVSSLAFITSLTHFDVSNNNVKQVPPQLAALGSKLVGIELIGNPFLFPRYQVLSRGSSYVLEYLRSRIPASQQE